MVKKTIMLIVVVSLLILAGCSNEGKLDKKNWPDKLEKTLEDYPYFFFEKNQTFNAVVVIDDYAGQEDINNAVALIEHYKQYDNNINESKVLKKYPTEYWDLTKQNTILIGSCTQEPHNQFINIFTDCLSMRKDQAIIRIINNHGAWVLNVMGYSPVETANAIEALKNYEDYKFTDYHVEVVRIDGKIVVRGPR